MLIKTKRIYAKPETGDGERILVDRLWPRGLRKDEAKIALWLKDIAPSEELRKWFAHDPKKWNEFKRRYFAELYEDFKKRYANPDDPLFSIAIATGDWITEQTLFGPSRLLISTYEKFLSLLTDFPNVFKNQKLLIADEIQLLGDETRGATVEIICTLLKKQPKCQFVGLSACIPNSNDLANWLDCQCVEVQNRDVPLRQEAWDDRNIFAITFGSDEEYVQRENPIGSTDTLEIVEWCLQNKLGPVLVFTMTKPRAVDLARELKWVGKKGAEVKRSKLQGQLRLFSEPSDLLATLSDAFERGVAFHTADLYRAERNVVEQGITDGTLQVVFATPTLASGVNFPIRTVVFDDWFRSWTNENIGVDEYLNMAGRAGRLGFHEEGLAIIKAKDHSQQKVVQKYHQGELESVSSQLLNVGLRGIVLKLVSSKLVNNLTHFVDFIKKSYWGFVALNQNLKAYEKIEPKTKEAIRWLAKNKFLVEFGEKLSVTPLGKVISSSGVQPETGRELVELLNWLSAQLESGKKFEDLIVACIHGFCLTDDLNPDKGRTALLYSKRQEWGAHREAIRTNIIFRDLDDSSYSDRVHSSTFTALSWIKETAEAKLRKSNSNAHTGSIHQLAETLSWICKTCYRLSELSCLKVSHLLRQSLRQLSLRLRWGCPLELVELLEIAVRYNVPGLGRGRAMKLYEKKLTQAEQILSLELEQLASILESKERARALQGALAKAFKDRLSTKEAFHISQTASLNQDRDFIKRLYKSTGQDYDLTVTELFNVVGLKAFRRDRLGMSKGDPDIEITHNGERVFVECKTTKDTGLFSCFGQRGIFDNQRS